MLLYVLIVNPSPEKRQLIRGILDAQLPRLHIDEAEHAEGALDMMEHQRYNTVLTELDMGTLPDGSPRMNGTELWQQASALYPKTKWFMVTHVPPDDPRMEGLQGISIHHDHESQVNALPQLIRMDWFW